MWTTRQAATTYSLAHWGQGYFDVASNGHLCVRPHSGAAGEIDLHAVARQCRERGLQLPVLVRFIDILHDRVDRLCGAFDRARETHGYAGAYTAVYPVKVNQQASVVEAILGHGNGRVGLEAGSKTELLAVLGLSATGGLVICNGYKDRGYVRLALTGLQLGLRVFIVIEKPSELALVLEESERLGVEPLLGVRIRLASLGAGKWQNTGGEKSKFGLSMPELVQFVARLGAAGRLHWLRLLHCHMGSQIANIRDIRRGFTEVARTFGELHRHGAPLDHLDIGGGLGVDYEGTGSRSFCSMNYSVQDYAEAAVGTVTAVCRAQGIPEPVLITEAGRAMTAHHAVLITNVVDAEHAPGTGDLQAPAADAPRCLHELWRLLEQPSPRLALELYHEAGHWLAEARDAYLQGELELAQRAEAEALYYALCHRLRPLLGGGRPAQREALDELNEILADKYFCNFSLFQSVPDAWAIDQVFPIVPLHRLDDPPTRRVILQDLTCDSDGRIRHYVGSEGVERTLPAHPWQPGEEYLLGIFLVGAYQEILGDMHNLFGDTHAVDVRLDGAGGFALERPEPGDTASDLLRYVHLAPEALRARLDERLAAAGLGDERRAEAQAEIEAALGGYTYLEQ